MEISGCCAANYIKCHIKKFFNQEIETTPQDELISRQNEKFKEKVRYVFENNAYMRDLYTKAGVDANDFRGIEDMDKLPVIAKANFRETYPSRSMLRS